MTKQQGRMVWVPDEATIMRALRDSKPSEKERTAATHVRWKDGIDIDEPALWLTEFARLIIAAAPSLPEMGEL